MLKFSKEFFLEETREDFTIDSTMKTFWAAELEVLREISEVCERHGLQWYAAYGTLLGAIRHEGYVPWDDDVDIWMKREDYNIFMQVAPTELPKDFVVRSPLTDAGYTQFHSCVFNSMAINNQKEWIEQFHGCPFAVGIDIFPLDYLPQNEDEREGQRALFVLIQTTIELVKKIQEDAKNNADAKSTNDGAADDADEEAKQKEIADDIETLMESFDTIEELCGITLSREFLRTDKDDKLLQELYILENQLCDSYGENDGTQLVMYMDYVNWPTKIYEKEWFSDVIMQPFEEVEIPVPVGYDEILKRIYGDYHVRVRGGGCHDYPLYQKQLDYLKKVKDGLEEKSERLEKLLIEARGH